MLSGLLPMQSLIPFLAEGLQFIPRSTYPFSVLSHLLKCTLLLEVSYCCSISNKRGISLRAVLYGMTLLLVYACTSPSNFPILSPKTCQNGLQGEWCCQNSLAVRGFSCMSLLQQNVLDLRKTSMGLSVL